MVDAADLKSASCKGVWVRVPPSAISRHHTDPRDKASENSVSMTNDKVQMTETSGFDIWAFGFHRPFELWHADYVVENSGEGTGGMRDFRLSCD
jgi:hypothetical protein